MVAISLGSVAGSGCVSQTPLVHSYGGPEVPSEAVTDRFAYSERPVHNRATDVRRRSEFTVREIEFPLNLDEFADGGVMRLEYYDLDGAERTPVIVLLPVLNRRLSLSRYFARYFAAHGYAAVVVDRSVPMKAYMDDPERGIRRGVQEYRRVLDWVEQNPDFDPDGVGLFGVSLGGINAVLVSALDERVDAVVAAMAGGDLPYIFENTHATKVIRTGSTIMRENGLSKRELAIRLRQSISTDPLDVAAYVDARKALMILARSDRVVPFEKQEELRTRMGGPEALYLPTGHRTSVIFLPLMRRSAHRFFSRQFDS